MLGLVVPEASCVQTSRSPRRFLRGLGRPNGRGWSRRFTSLGGLGQTEKGKLKWDIIGNLENERGVIMISGLTWLHGSPFTIRGRLP